MKTWTKIFCSSLLAAAAFAQPAAAPMPAAPLAPLMWMAQGMGGSYLGVGVQDVDGDRAKALNLREVRGVELTRVDEEAPAGKAGLKAGDVVMEYNGQRVEGLEQFMRYVRETPAGREVKLLISRGGQTQTVAVTTARRKPMVARSEDGSMRIEIPRMEMPPMPSMPAMGMDIPRSNMSWRSGMLGIEGEAVDGPLAEFFGVKEGVLIRNIGKGTAAEKAGLKVGDVLTKVDASTVATPRQITSTIRGLKEKRTFPVVVMREKREMTVSVTVEEPAERPAAAPRARSVNNE
jgi:serine protease Do